MTTKKPIKTYELYEVVKVPYPFVDIETTKVRPAVVLSSAKVFNAKMGCNVMAMITSVKKSQDAWVTDIEIEDLEHAGLPVPSLIRFKIFTLDHRLIIERLGILSVKDRIQVQKKLREVLAL